MRIVIAGSRACVDPAVVDRAISASPWAGKVTCVVEGGARGVDELARRWAEERNVAVVSVLAEWDKYGRAAGPIRNRRMLRDHAPDGVVVIWDGRTHGSASMIREAKNAKVPVFEFRTEGGKDSPAGAGDELVRLEGVLRGDPR